jgi:hypothetical protein
MGICLTHHATIRGMREWKSIHGTSICRGLVSEADTQLAIFQHPCHREGPLAQKIANL